MLMKNMQRLTSAPDEAYTRQQRNVRRQSPAPGGPRATERAVADGLRRAAPVVLAVSGGRDSVALLCAAARAAPGCVAAVATFDHGTGSASAAAANLVADYARKYRMACRRGRAPGPVVPTEASWRAERWRFLRETAAAVGARAIVTAHTRDDQVETVFIRVLRQAGTRGLAALDIDSDVVRPWLATPRAAVAAFAAIHGLRYVEDPSNASRAFLRNRVRLDLLPALRAAHPGFDDDLLALGAAAASWRRSAEGLVGGAYPLRVGVDGVSIAAGDLAQYDGDSLAVVWPVIAARAGVTLDRRGTARLATFTRCARVGGVMQVSGGFEVLRSRFSWVVRRPGYVPVPLRERHGRGIPPLVEGGAIRWVRPAAPGL